MSAEEDRESLPESPGPAEDPSIPTDEGASGGDEAEMETSPFEAPTMDEINLSDDFPSPREREDD